MSMDKTLAVGFLRAIFARVPPEQWISIFAKDRTADQSARSSNKVLWSEVGDIEKLVERLEPLSDSHCIWFGVATRRQRLSEGRGGDADCALVPAMWADLDITGPGHRSAQLPPTEEDALKLMEGFPPATFVVRTGGGLQPFWLLDEPIPMPDAIPVLDRWAYSWQQRSAEFGWHVDNVHDAARVLRVPGTTNWKVLSDPRPVTLLG